jgi:hypothetical protein
VRPPEAAALQRIARAPDLDQTTERPGELAVVSACVVPREGSAAWSLVVPSTPASSPANTIGTPGYVISNATPTM